MKRPSPKTADPILVKPGEAEVNPADYVRIRSLIDANKMVEAWSLAKTLYESHPNDAFANYALALIFNSSKQRLDALRHARAAAAYSPDNAKYQLFLGKLCVDFEMFEFAPAPLEKAFALDKTMFQAPWIMAEYYFGLGSGERAVPYFKQALAAAPVESLKFVKWGYASCAVAMGLIDEAEAIYSELLDDPKLRLGALTRLAMLKKNNHESEFGIQIQKELAAKDLDNSNRSQLLQCLGRLYENARQFDTAFHCLEESRKLLVSAHDMSKFKVTINDSINSFTSEVVAKFHGFGDPSTKPIFVVGMPRSGTTLAEQILAAHSQVKGVGELKRVSQMFREFSGGKGTGGVLAKMTEVGPEKWKAMSRQYLNLIDVLAAGADYAVDKMPHNFLYIGFIHFCYPNAKFVHCKRNPLDSFISAFQNRMNRQHGYAYDQSEYGAYYLEYARLMDHWKSIFPDSIHELQYESLVQNPETEVRRLLEFLGLPWEEGCLKFNEQQSMVKTFSQLQVRNAINTGSIGRWRNYQKHLAPIISLFEQAEIRF
jgi:tetratricopeptide (TPR) repeat protein